MKSYYIDKLDAPALRRNFAAPENGVKRLLSFSVLVMFLLISCALSISSASTSAKADSYDPIQDFMCHYELTEDVYRASQEDLIPFKLFSKSAVHSGMQNVDEGLNSVLSATGGNFNEINSEILGRDITDTKDDGEKEKYNKSKRAYSPYERFGVAGMSFTSYQGEWKYYQVDSCSNGDVQFNDPGLNRYYDGRMSPESTWEYIDSSTDVRSQQRGHGFFYYYLMGADVLIANTIFSLTKLIVGLSIAFINIAFSDIPKLMGFDTILLGGGESDGIINVLFGSLYKSTITVAFTLTGMSMVIKMAQGRFRNALDTAIRAVAMYFVAVVFMTYPAFFVNLPNLIATTGQALIVTTVTGSGSGEGICGMGEIEEAAMIDEENKSVPILEQYSKSMSNTIGCSLWQQFLLRPWSEGQYGKSWNELWAEGQTPEWAKDSNLSGSMNHGEIKYASDNAKESVGDAAVPLGNDEVINNWGIFQISTQTNAHAPIGKDGGRDSIANGLNTDWWRTVDVLSGYDRKTAEDIAADGGSGNAISSSPDESWWTWIGGAGESRVMIAISSVLFALIGTIALLFFALMSSVLGVMATMLMVIAPIALLAAIWGDNGWSFFAGWFNWVLETTTARIACGFLLVITFLVTDAVIGLISQIGWWASIGILGVVVYAIIKNRKSIISEFNVGRLSTSVDLTQTGGQVREAITSRVGAVGGVIGAGAGGAIRTKSAGGTLAEGFSSGAKAEARARAKTSPLISSAMLGYDEVKIRSGESDLMDDIEFCESCGRPIREVGGGVVAVTQDRMYVCWVCYNSNAHVTRLGADHSKTKLIDVDWNAIDKRTKEKEAMRNFRENRDPARERGAYSTGGENRNAERVIEERIESLAGDVTDAYKHIKVNPEDIDRFDEAIESLISTTADEAARVEDAILLHQLEVGIAHERGEEYPGPPEPSVILRKVLRPGAIEDLWKNTEYDGVRAIHRSAWANVLAASLEEVDDKTMSSVLAELDERIRESCAEQNRAAHEKMNPADRAKFMQFKSIDLDEVQRARRSKKVRREINRRRNKKNK